MRLRFEVSGIHRRSERTGSAVRLFGAGPLTSLPLLNFEALQYWGGPPA